MSTGFAFKQRLHLCSLSNLRIFLGFQLRTFKVRFSCPKTFRGFRETGPRGVGTKCTSGNLQEATCTVSWTMMLHSFSPRTSPTDSEIKQRRPERLLYSSGMENLRLTTQFSAVKALDFAQEIKLEHAISNVELSLFS